jgi:hypothetical protein
MLALGMAISPLASAEWSVFGDLERFRWKEDISPSVTETGPMVGLGLRWRQDQPAGLGFGYESRLYGGSVNYDGALLFTGEPISGTTVYGGWRNELRATYRFVGSPGEVVLGAGYDYWNRQLTADQHEEYNVAYLRLGFDIDRRLPTGWFGGGGVKYPFFVDENAHFPEIGFVPNTHLRPKGEASLYAEVGYRFNPRVTLAGYYDSYRFEASDAVLVTDGVSTEAFFQPKSSLDSLGLRLRYSF